MVTKTYFIKTFGCQMNVSDSERIASFLEMLGYQKIDTIEKANLVIFNTCGIKQTAENRAYSTIHTLHKKYPEIKIILTGCLANRQDVQQRLKDKVDLFCEIKDFPKKFVGANLVFAKDCNRQKKGQTQGLSLRENYLCITPKYSDQFSASIPIMTGCNNFCSYCVVPYARGREWSRPMLEIISEIKTALKNGAKEIILLGQNVNSYGANGISFPALLQKIEKIPGHFWLRFISSHPKDFSDELIEAIAASKKICEHIHLPIQAGANEILTKMNRKYTAEHYLQLIEKIRMAFQKHKPDVLYALTSDIIVGFPGETKKQFLGSAEVMKRVSFDMVYFGQFSPRPGTAAWEMRDNVTQAEKARREKFLNEILKKTVFANNKKYLHQNLEVLVTEKKNGAYFGRTRTMKNLKITSEEKNLVGKFINVEITKVDIWNLEGKIIK